jgi:hypothetical protein
MSTLEKQYLQSFTVLVCFFRFSLFMVLTKANIISEITKKLIAEFRNTPILIVTAPSSFACAKDLYFALVIAVFFPRFSNKNIFAKSTPRSSMPIGGMMTSFTREFTIFPNAPPTDVSHTLSTNELQHIAAIACCYIDHNTISTK